MREQLTTAGQNKRFSITCPYCGASLIRRKDNYYCAFCRMEVDQLEVQTNEKRYPSREKRTILDVHLQKSTPELMQFSTLELLELLEIGRRERRDMKELLMTIQKLKAAGKKEEMINEENISKKEHEKITRKVFAIETILKQRLDFVPKVITEEALMRYAEKVNRENRQQLL